MTMFIPLLKKGSVNNTPRLPHWHVSNNLIQQYFLGKFFLMLNQPPNSLHVHRFNVFAILASLRTYHEYRPK